MDLDRLFHLSENISLFILLIKTDNEATGGGRGIITLIVPIKGTRIEQHAIFFLLASDLLNPRIPKPVAQL